MSEDKTYQIHGGDLVLSILDLPDPCPIRVILTSEYVKLYVGPRDWQWHRDTGELMGSGTILADNVPKEAEDDGNSNPSVP